VSAGTPKTSPLGTADQAVFAIPKPSPEGILKAVVTGGAGFIGSNLVDALVERDDEVTVLDDISTGRHQNLDYALARGARLIECDIRDAGRMIDLLAAAKPEVVYHLAAQIDVRVSTARPAFDTEVNVLGTVNMLEAARAAGARRFVYTSTGGAIYGEADQLPTPEDAPISPEAPYGQAKYCGEGYCALYRRLHRLSTVSMRLGNVFGPRQDPLGEAGVIAIFCGRLLDGGQPTVFGDGEQTRDYIYVGDVVDAITTTAAADAHGAFNVGRGVGTSVLQLVDSLRALGNELGVRADGFEPQFAPPRPGEVQRSTLDPTKARAELGFEASVDIDEGLRRTLESLRS
jgi:UDP-glucose 4-epimerase